MDSSSTQLSWNDETPRDGTIYHQVNAHFLVALKDWLFFFQRQSVL